MISSHSYADSLERYFFRTSYGVMGASCVMIPAEGGGISDALLIRLRRGGLALVLGEDWRCFRPWFEGDA